MADQRINVVIGADTKGLNRGLSRARANIAKFAKVATAAFAALAVAVVALTKRSLANIDVLAKQARSLGLTTRALQAMTMVADEAGVSAGALSSMLGIMQRNIIELGKGTKAQEDAFKRLNITITDLNGLSADEQFERIAVALNGIVDPATRTATAMDIFGRSGRGAINMLEGYSDKVKEAAGWQKRFNIAVSEKGAAAVEKANDAVGRLKSAFSGLGNIIAVSAAPHIERIAIGLSELVVRIPEIVTMLNDKFGPSLRAVGKIVSDVAGGIFSIGRALVSAGEGIISFYESAKEAAKNFGFTAENMFGPDVAKGMGAVLDPQGGRITGADGFGLLRSKTSGRSQPDPGMFITPMIDPFPDGFFGDGTGGDGTGGGGAGGGAGGAITDAFAERLAALQEGLMTEREVITEWYAEGQSVLADALDQEKLTTEEHKDAMLRLEEEYQERLGNIRNAGNKFGLQSTLKGGAQILGAMGSFNKKALKVSQAFAAAEALVSTFQGAAKELARGGTLGFPLAAAVIAKGLAFVGAIKGASASGGGGGGAVSAPAAAPAPQQISRHVTVDMGGGGMFSGDQVRGLINQINTAVEDGANLRLV